MDYDVVVIGAGPGGCGAALSAASQGLNVLVVEKRQEIGAPKRCGEGLSRSSLERMGVELDKRWVNREIMGATVYAPNGKPVRIDYKDGPEGWVIERKIFDKFLARKAAKAGAKVLAKTEALGLIKDGNKITGVKLESSGETWDVRTKIVIAADGVESKIAREAGLDTTLKLVDIASSAQFEMTGIDIDPDRMELYFGWEIAPGGYVWIFPKDDDTANVGVGVRKVWTNRTALDYLKKFVDSRPGLKKGSIIEVNSGGVPVGGLMRDMVLDNFMVVGDAAHQVNPIHGGGISEAFVGGKIAGSVAAEAVKRNDFSKQFLERYNKLWWQERGNKLNKILKLRKVVESLSDEDLNWLAEFLTGNDLIDFSRSEGLKKLAQILVKKPKLALLARKLL